MPMSLSRQSSTRSVQSRARNHNSGSKSSNPIKVVARFRPDGGESSVEDIASQHVKIHGIPQPFVFDTVLGPDTEQFEVFQDIKPTVDGVLAGYNGCVLAYGQTGSGKSHTMMGTAGRERGVIPRIVEHLFAEKSPDTKLSVGYLEIYNEKVRDLLADHDPIAARAGGKNAINSGDLKLYEQFGTFHVKGLTRHDVFAVQDVLALMERGSRSRSTAATRMNNTSSRSHSLFSLEVVTRATRSKLVLVDLAGSEKVAKTGAKGVLLEEAGNINKSLSSLGMVVNALANNQAAGDDASLSHVPFRDSKLTRILQDSLAGNSRTCLIIHCSPAAAHISETVSTLRFGTRAKTVQTQMLVNYTPASASSASAPMDILRMQQELHAQLLNEKVRLVAQHRRAVARQKAQREYIESLKRELDGVYMQSSSEELYLIREAPILGSRIASLTQ